MDLPCTATTVCDVSPCHHGVVVVVDRGSFVWIDLSWQYRGPTAVREQLGFEGSGVRFVEVGMGVVPQLTGC